MRIRVCGIYIENNKVLVAKHSVDGKIFYCLPGGGVKKNEELKKGLEREFQEEFGIGIKIEECKAIGEFIENDYHCVELFFKINKITGNISLVEDDSKNVLKGFTWLKIEDLNSKDFRPKEILKLFSSKKEFEFFGKYN